MDSQREWLIGEPREDLNYYFDLVKRSCSSFFRAVGSGVIYAVPRLPRWTWMFIVEVVDFSLDVLKDLGTQIIWELLLP